MKKSSLAMILALVGMVGCQHGKKVEPPDLRHPVEGARCSIQAWASTAGESYSCVNGKWINNNLGLIIASDGGESVIHVQPRTGLEFCKDFQRAADEFNHTHPNDGVGYGCGNIHPAKTNPISPGNEVVILPATKFPVVSAAWVKEHECHEVYSSEPRDKFASYKLYRCHNLESDVEVDGSVEKAK